MGFTNAPNDLFKFCTLLFIHTLKYKYVSCVFLEQQGEVVLFNFWHVCKSKSVFAYLEMKKKFSVVKLNEK